jgi:hypothetical protein
MSDEINKKTEVRKNLMFKKIVRIYRDEIISTIFERFDQKKISLKIKRKK